jgi:hypothetical protein|tara:strand:+ start:2113 stop:2949 length:837 start_codon:yes stop_codon:yes gene_type:complete
MSWNTNTKTTKTFEERKKERLEKIKHKAQVAISFMCLGIWGEPKTAKTAIALDILTEEDIANDMKVYVFDFDNRAIDVKRNHYKNIDNIVVDNPIERKEDSLVDFDATMENARTFYEMAMECLNEGKLKAVIVDGADKLLTDVCETKMREKHKMDADAVIKQPPYVWGDRNTPYKNFLHKQILEMPCHRIVIAHSKDKYSGNPNPVGVEANWHSSTEDIFTSTIRMNRDIRKNGAEYHALFEASARKPELIGSRRLVLSIKDGEINWTGVEEIKAGEI